METKFSHHGLWDTHMHSQFSGDSEAPQEEMISSAIEKGLAGICFTDHLDIDYPEEPNIFLLDLPNYTSSVLAYQEKYAAKLPIRLGIELGLQPHLAALHTDILSQYPFDFVIGSSHAVHGKDPYYPDFYQNKAEDEAYAEYFSSILENIAVFDDFDVYGHLDYITRYAPDKAYQFDYIKHSEIIDCILKEIIHTGHGIEINTSPLNKGLSQANPCPEIVKRYRELGGKIITIGSDAHTAVNVGGHFDAARDILLSSGFKYYTVFTGRKKEMRGL